MPFFSRKQHSPSNSAPAIGLASHSQPVNPWSARALRLRHSPSPFPRYGHTLSTTAAGDLFLFGGNAHGSQRNDLYVFSTRITPQLSCRPVERLPAHVTHMVPRSPALSFWFGAGGPVARICKTRAVMIHSIFSTSACRIF